MLSISFAQCNPYLFYTPISLGPFCCPWVFLYAAPIYFIHLPAWAPFAVHEFCSIQSLFILYTHQLGPILLPMSFALYNPYFLFSNAVFKTKHVLLNFKYLYIHFHSQEKSLKFWLLILKIQYCYFIFHDLSHSCLESPLPQYQHCILSLSVTNIVVF